MSRRLFVVTVGLGTLLARGASAQVVSGPEFRVNSYTTGRQDRPEIAAGKDGGFVIVWESEGQDSGAYDVFARRYLPSGVPVEASGFRVNTYTSGSHYLPAVAANAAGQMVVVWQYVSDGSYSGIAGRRYDPAGTPGPEFRVNTYTTGEQTLPGVAMDAAGNFVVVWASSGEMGPGFEVFAQRFDASGAPQGPEFPVHTSGTLPGGGPPRVGMNSAGNFVVVWASSDGSFYGVSGRRYDAAGAPQGPEFQVNTYTTGIQNRPAVAVAASGDFVVVWETYGQDGSDDGIFGRAYNAAGAPQGGEFLVNEVTGGAQRQPRVAMDPKGSFEVVWRADTTGYDIKGRMFGVTHQPKGSEFLVNAFTTGDEVRGAVVVQPGGRFAVTWDDYPQDGSNFGVYARRLAGDVIFRDGFESGGVTNWSSQSSNGSDLLVTPAAALKSTAFGLEGIVSASGTPTPIYVEDDSPIDEDRYRARFYFDTNAFDPGESGGAHRTRIFIVFEEAPNRRLAAIVLKRLDSVYSVMGRARLDDDSQADTGFFDISDGPHFVEIDWKRSRSAVANDGTFQLSIDGTPVSTLTGLDNNRSAVDFVRLGALSIKATANGTLYWDEFESRRINSIGP